MKKRILNTFFIVLSVVFIFFDNASLLWGKIENGQTCPVMPGRPVKDIFFVDYNGERIYLCCGACVKAFKKHPEKYMKNIKH